MGRTAVKLGGNPFRTILHISFSEADFFGWPSVRVSAKGAAWGESGGGVVPTGEIDPFRQPLITLFNSMNWLANELVNASNLT